MPNTFHPSRRDAISGSATVLASSLLAPTVWAAAATKVLVFVGPSNHPPGTHEVAAGGHLLAHCLTAAGVAAESLSEWPKHVESYRAVVFIGDLFPPEVMPNREAVMADLTAMMKRGCGMVCLHYATGLEAKHVSAQGDHPLLHWIGGYFATRCNHHKSIAKVFQKATIEPAKNEHPILHGWKPFTLHDEPYINNYFGKDGPAKGVSVLATSQLPPEQPKAETVGWAIERADGGRGCGIVMPHFYKNWTNDQMRTFILNGIVWAAKQEVPPMGVQVKLPDLTTFMPASVEPQPRKKG